LEEYDQESPYFIVFK